MNEEDAKSETRTVWTETDRGVSHSSVAGWEEGAGVHSEQHGDFGDRIVGTVGTGPHSNYLVLLTGGIISQLIADAEDRLGQSEECIEWYVREKEENLKRLENLRKLQRLAEQQQQANGDQIGE